MSVTDKALKVVVERPASPPVSAVPSMPAAVFTSDDTPGTPASAHRAQAAFLAELALHQAVATPLCVGLFGPAGAGKTTLLASTLQATETLGRAADAVGLATPFLGDATTLRISVEPGLDPSTAILQQAFAGLSGAYPDLVSAAGEASHDPRAAARDAGDRLNEARHRLDDERRKLDELSARQARLMESVLFEAAGSRIDSYARLNRGRIDRSLRRFGFQGDTAVTYKELVRDAAEPGVGRGLGWLSAFWAYRGQTRLIVVAVAFLVLSWLLGLLMADQDSWIASLRSSNDRMGPIADWLAAHGHWLAPLQQTAALAGLAALAINIVRGMRFIQPVARGAALLRSDIEGRRRDLDGLVAHQARRVDTLARDVETASARAAEAENRLAAISVEPTPQMLFAPEGSRSGSSSRHAAATFFAALSQAIGRRGRERTGTGAPARLVVGLDGFERVTGREAAAFLDTAHQLLAHPGIVTFLAADRAQLASGLAETDPALATATLNRIVQVPVAVGGEEGPCPDARHLVQSLLKPAAAPSQAGPDVAAEEPDAGRSAFDRAWLPKESALLEALAPFAGSSPRAVKRYVNLYRVARADPGMVEANIHELAALALGLALQSGGGLPPASLLTSGSLNGEVQAARHAAATALGVALDLTRDGRGLETARRYGAV
ncbi:hypothetical protein [Lichenifustis flavocetrariae]|uniref:Uncharacterized protein n=1 Tax=Lichenifustis flavocetrariae TaxID=2949735 RepID=A0AA41Z5C9_9HYPH|nr:hypothetical protein [Lichenifustis flavocetrariae]MCW6509582.1 hypothetical protein [Lichenifustis flavocetrariae]